LPKIAEIPNSWRPRSTGLHRLSCRVPSCRTAVRARPARPSLPRADAVADYDAAPRISPKTASSLYGRGIARSRTGDAAGGDADIVRAKALQPDIADGFARFGIG
jgi:hypothetical protein